MHKGLVLAFSLAGLAALGLLAAALHEVEFQPAGPLPFSFSRPAGLVNGPGMLNLPFLQWFIVIVLVILVLGFALALINRQTRKRVLLALLRFVLTLLGLWWLFEYSGLRLGREMPLISGEPAGPAALSALQQSPAPEFAPPQVNSWLGFWVSFGLALGLVALLWWFLRRTQTRQGRPYADLAGIARQALDGLQEGHNWDDAIVAAYIRMNEAVSAERGLIRQPATTPAEFATRMEQAGLPGEAARSLTRLFEQVRYGAQPSTRQERDQAAAALGAILQACGAGELRR